MDEQLKVLRTFSFSLRAYLTKGRLESEGISCWMMSDSEARESSLPEKKYVLKVRESDFERAAGILDSLIMEEVGGGMEEDSGVNLHRILVPVDFSDSSPNLSLIAAGLAGNFGASVRLFHAYFVPALDIIPVSENSVFPVTLDEHILTVEQEARGKMEKLLEFLQARMKKLGMPEIKLDYSLSSGFPEDEILEEYYRYQPNLIIMGTGINERSMDIYGSVTAQVVEHVKVPVLAIPPNLHYLDMKAFRQVMYATNFDASDFRAIHKLLFLTQPFDTNIHLVHCRTGRKDDWDTIRLEGLKDQLKKEFIDQEVEVAILESENIIQAFEEYIRLKEIDLIAVTTRKRNFISRLFKPGIARSLLVHSHRPILVFH